MVLFMFFSNAIKQRQRTNVPKYPLLNFRSRRLHIIILLSISSFCTTYMMSAIGITMTCMVNSTAEVLRDDANEYQVYYSPNYDTQKCTVVNNSNPTYPTDYGGTLNWSHGEQNMVFAGAFWGGCLSVLPSMFLLQRYPTKYVFLTVIALYTLSNSLTPLFAQELGYQATIAVRFLLGMADGFVTPSIDTFISQWFPVSERGTALGFNAIGEQLAIVTESPLAALFCQSSMGWPAVYYMAGIFGTIWCLLWILFGSSNPYECSKISEKERNYLLAANGLTMHKKEVISWRNLPFKAIFTSIPFLAQLQCHFLMCFASALLGTYLPTFFKEVLLLGVITNGLYISLPNFFNLIGKVVWGIAFDRLKQNDILSPTTAAKFSQAVSSYGMAISFICLALFVDCSQRTLALIICCFLFLCQGIECSGFVTSLLSIAPRYTASLSSISLFMAQLGTLATPYVVSAYQTKDRTNWTALFLTAAGISAISGTIFIIFGSGEVQRWALEERESTRKLSESETCTEVAA